MLFTEQGNVAEGPGAAEVQPTPGSLSQASIRHRARPLRKRPCFRKGFICIWIPRSLVLKIFVYGEDIHTVKKDIESRGVQHFGIAGPHWKKKELSWATH